MKLFEFLYSGGFLFMIPITICGLLVVFFSIYKIFRMVKKHFDLLQLNYILLFGSLAFMIGLLGQGIGLSQALKIVSRPSEIPSTIILDGVKVTLIAPVFGLIVFLISLLFWSILKEINLRKIKGKTVFLTKTWLVHAKKNKNQ